MMTAEQLKASILQMAMQGKLVPQDPNDESASGLLKKITTEKEKLISEGKIKKEKQLTPITEDEIPFDIPDSWEWVRLGEISSYSQPKKKLSYQDIKPDMWSLDLEDIEKGSGRIIKRVKAKDRKIKGDKICFERGNILYSKLRPYLLKILIADDNGITSPELIPFNIYGDCYQEYFLWYLRSPYVDNAVNAVSYGVKMPRVGTDTMRNLLVPLPPFAEQKRIVAKIEELMPYVDQYAEASSRLTTLNTSFPDQMKKSILQQAVQGKLVPQDPDDEPASELVRKITAEKEQLIAEGKIKKEKKLLPITEDELPFEIPENWTWTRLQNILNLENGDRSGKYPKESDYKESGIPFFGAKDIVEGTMSLKNVRYISQEKFDELGHGKLEDKDIVCLLRGSVGKSAIFRAFGTSRTGFICAQMVIMRLYLKDMLDYAWLFMQSPLYINSVSLKVTGTAVKQLPAAEIGKILIPIPPLAEQKRIVARTKELMPYCDVLKDKQEKA